MTTILPPPRGGTLTKEQRRFIGLASLGGSLEYYDFVIYGIFAQYISRQFFPSTDPYVSLILSFSVLALGFLARPLGGVVIGGLGDRYGRRPVFIASLGLTTLATILIGLLPSYASWGLAAPLLLVVLRLVQGMCLGGELPGALTYAIEAAPLRSGLACGLIILCVNAGVLVATLVNLAIQHLLPVEDVAVWGWRCAFLFGGLIGVVSFGLRQRLEESPEFLKMRDVAPRSPLRELLRTQVPSMLVAAGVAATIAGFNGMLYGFVPAWLVQSLHYAPSEAALAMTVALIASSAGLIVSGWAGDRIPGRLILRVGTALLIVVVYPIHVALVAHSASPVLLLAVLSLVFSITSGIWPSVLAGLFPTRVRFTGIAFSYNISVTLLSGFAPLAATLLIAHTGNPAAPALYIAACTALSLVASFFVRSRLVAVRNAQAGSDHARSLPEAVAS